MPTTGTYDIVTIGAQGGGGGYLEGRGDYEADAFDAGLGTPGLHRVAGRVEWRPRPSVLPPDLFERFSGDSFWRKPQPRLAHLPAIVWRGGG